MKKCKKLTAAVLAAAMTLTSLPSVTAEEYLSVSDVMKRLGVVSEVNAGEESPAEDFEYSVNGDRESVTITGYNGEGGDVVIPSVIDGKKVTVIGMDAFSGCTYITSVEIPDSVTAIDWDAFYRCTSLASVKIPDSVTEIGYEAFCYCSSLTSVEIPNSVTKVDERSFSGCNALTIYGYENSAAQSYAQDENIPFKKIGKEAIIDHKNNIIIENPNLEGMSLEVIKSDKSTDTEVIYDILLKNKDGDEVKPDGEVTVKIPLPENWESALLDRLEKDGTLTEIAKTLKKRIVVFQTEDLGTFKLTIKVLETPGETGEYNDYEYTVNADGESVTITGYTGEGGDVVIPEEIEGKKTTVKVTSIGSGAFYGCTSLTSVKIPDGVATIGYSAFDGCTSLTSVEIPYSVIWIADYEFENCNSLKSINVDEKNTVYSSVDGVLFNKDKTTLIQYPAGKTDKSYSIPNSVTEIGISAFSRCTSLTTVEIPNSVTEIGGGAFSGCTSLASVKIPESMTKIGNSAFSGCISLVSVEIPESVTWIGSWVFSGCTSLASINVDEKNADYSSVDGVLFDKDKTTLKQYPVGKTDKSYSIPNGVTAIESSAFDGCTSLTSVEIPNSVTWIGMFAFSRCTSLTSMEIPDSVTYIENLAFSRCTSLTSINVDEKNADYSSVDGVLFNKDKTILIQYPVGKTDKSYSIPNSVTEIGSCAFEVCTYITSVEIPDSVERIAWSAFYGCTYLTSVEIPDSVTVIGSEAFSDCTSLTSAKIPDSVTVIGNIAFSDCPNLTIYGYTDSYAEEYANENEINFVSIDDSTKIQIDGGIVVTVPEDSKATLEGKTLEVEGAKFDTNSATFNITLKDKDGKEVQPGGEVTVKIPVPANLDGKKCNVYRKEADGTYTELKSTYENGCLIFVTDHFSEYVISAVKPVSIKLGDPNKDGRVSTVDAKWVLQAISGSRTLTEEQKAAADVNKDGKITTVDAKWILQSVSGSRDLE